MSDNNPDAVLFQLYSTAHTIHETFDFIDQKLPHYRPRTRSLRVELEDSLDTILAVTAHLGWSHLDGQAELRSFRESYRDLLREIQNANG